MLRRPAPGPSLRRMLGPLGERIGVDVDMSFAVPPLTDEARALHAIACGGRLLFAFTNADEWPPVGGRQARRAARWIADSYTDDRCRDASSALAQGHGQLLAEQRLLAAQQEPDGDTAESLRYTAQLELDLAALTKELWSAWPEDFPTAVREAIAGANEVRGRPIGEEFAFSHARIEVTVEGLALALGPERWEKLREPLLYQVTLPDLRFAAFIGTDWEWVNSHWVNLLQPDPAAPVDVDP